MLYYLVYIFNMAGMTGNTALTSSIIQYVIFLVTTGLVLPFIDRLGRRPLLIGGALICGILHFTSGAVMAVHGYPVDGIEGKSYFILQATAKILTLSRQRHLDLGHQGSSRKGCHRPGIHLRRSLRSHLGTRCLDLRQ